tara:strand:+ start:754 stop:1005 length:252 start_codon:yes stop_codon:yes gene_type:complete
MTKEYEQYMESEANKKKEDAVVNIYDNKDLNEVRIVDVDIPFLSVLMLVFKYTIAFFLVSLFVFCILTIVFGFGVIGFSSYFY